jgi:KUP system potassium uptake protein
MAKANLKADSRRGHAQGHGQVGLAGLVLGAIGVVFGDIGTSPLYTIKEAFIPHYGLDATDPAEVLGLLSLIFWALMVMVTLKYVAIIMRADNEGEGGIMALMTLAQRTLPKGGRGAYAVGILGIFGASLFFGDSVITPPVSVLGALEGIEVVAPQMHDWIVPMAVVIMLVLFSTQRFGTEKVGRVFGPITLVWFVSIAALGVLNIRHNPEVVQALNPWWGMKFFMAHGWHGIFILGAVVLAVTGGEALYADMGHFGAKPIRYAWYFLVLPALMLNYLGQGALVLENPEAVKNPFYVGVPDWAQWPMIALATMAAIIASQAVITGAFSVTQQAIQLGFMPRMTIKHTSLQAGQIYIPVINFGLMIAVILLVLVFQRSSNLTAAYGIAVTGAMLIDTFLLSVVLLQLWKWKPWAAIPLLLGFLLLDAAYLGANLT